MKRFWSYVLLIALVIVGTGCPGAQLSARCGVNENGERYCEVHGTVPVAEKKP